MKNLLILTTLLAFSLANCGGFKVGLDEATLKKIDSVFGDKAADNRPSASSDSADSSSTDSQDSTDAGSTASIKSDAGAIFVGSYVKWGDTCIEYDLKDSVRIFETDEQVLFYDEVGPEAYLVADKYSQDNTLDLGISGSFGNDDLSCVCTVETDASIQCHCENNNTQCAVIWGQL